MTQEPVAITKNPAAAPAEDYYLLRRKGIGFVEAMGSTLWTDYNLHDPGITILEVICYALTDLAYRTGWDISDLLTNENNEPAGHQAFFTARTILTVNPWTTDDYRRLLIDLDSVRNAWVFCKKCACDFPIYASCEAEQLQLSYQEPDNQKGVKVEPRGLYEVLLELTSSPESGDLSDRKIEQSYTLFDDDDEPHTGLIEVRFPEWSLSNSGEYALFLENDTAVGVITLFKFSRSKTDSNVMGDDEMRRNWRGVFYTTFEVALLPGSQKIKIENAAIRLFGDEVVKQQSTVAELTHLLADATAAGLMHKYQRKLKEVARQIALAKEMLQSHRNLDEDYCRIEAVSIEDVAVCADIEVQADVDIERVQAEIWQKIAYYFSPPVPFYSLRELREQGMPVEEIFNGPELQNGFITSEDLAAAQLKTVLHTSDIINVLMDIEGVIAVNNLLLTKYDQEGLPVKGAADGNPNKLSAQWALTISDNHQPRLYYNLSRFLFYKNGLPLLPRMDEARDTLVQLLGEAETGKGKDTLNDLPVPVGTYRAVDDYFPLQYSFPLTYGIGKEGLSSNVPTLRKAQARQLKAYLMVYEQFFVNDLMQLAHVGDLFSLDTAVKQTYFSERIDNQLINGADALLENTLTADRLHSFVESESDFLERRNRFLNHLMARFGEDVNEYARLLFDWKGQKIALEELIADKIAFLNAYPVISHDRAKALNYALQPFTLTDNRAGVELKLEKILGIEQLMVVEHLLLRPKFLGDALYPICSDGDCEEACCGDHDPYSFRLTYVMPGWPEPFATNMELRLFADRTIRQETPSHLLPKICWVSETAYNDFKTAWENWLTVNATHDWISLRLQERVEAILTANHVPNAAQPAALPTACACALRIVKAYGQLFFDLVQQAADEPPTLTDDIRQSPIVLCDGHTFANGTEDKIREVLNEAYASLTEVSFRLRQVLDALILLENMYPTATLHDCDDGNDDNPVRLNNTALGS
ncbi:hypothetical protein [Runella sp.]|uniref:hypothetical protein n=1 Tax=Runella sp. TaxID=1960881 RepID=UPI003D0B405F